MKKDITIKEIQRFENYYDKIKNEELSTNLKEVLKLECFLINILKDCSTFFASKTSFTNKPPGKLYTMFCSPIKLLV